MSGKSKSSRRKWRDSDDAPEITQEWVDGANLYHGKKLVGPAHVGRVIMEMTKTVVAVSDKSESVREFVRTLAEHLGPQSFSVVDHWNADANAIGIANLADPRVLVYVSVNDSAPRYFLSFESPPAGEWADHPYTPGAEQSVETLSEAVALVRKHVA